MLLSEITLSVVLTCVVLAGYWFIRSVAEQDLSVIWLLLVLLAVALLVAVPKRFCTSRLAMALQKIPYTFLLMAGNIFKLRGANKSFIHTKHGVVEK